MTEQLQEILNRKPSKWGNLTVKEFERDIKLLQERVQELELRYGFKESQKGMKDALYDNLKLKNKQLKSNLNVYKGYYHNTLKHNKELIEQNKRYREAIEKIKNKVSQQLEGLDAEEEMERVIKLSELMSISIEALEGDSDE